jgi:hypothetical protein
MGNKMKCHFCEKEAQYELTLKGDGAKTLEFVPNAKSIYVCQSHLD